MIKHTITKALAIALTTSLTTCSLQVPTQASMFPAINNLSNISDICSASNINYSVNGKTVTITGTGSIDDGYLYKDLGTSSIATITKVVISSGITSIPNYFFSNMQNITEIEIADSVTKIGTGAFINLSKLTDIKLPKGLTEISSSLFYGCSSLKKVDIPEGVSRINSQSFTECSGLTDIYIPKSVSYIDGNTDFIRSGLTITTPSATIRDRYKDIDGVTINYTGETIKTGEISGVSYSLDTEKNTLTLTATQTNSTIPSNIAEKLESVSTIKKIILSGDFTRMGSKAFYNFSSLTEIELPDSVENISDSAFYGTDITSLRLPANLKVIESRGLANMYKLKEIKIPSSVYKIDKSAFSHCSSLEHIEIPDTVTSLCEEGTYNTGLFSDCKLLKSAVINAKATDIESQAFLGCEALETVSLPDTLSSIKERCFEGCKNLANIEIPESVTTIGKSAFYNCIKLTSVKLPSSIKKIPTYAFAQCTSLKNINIPDSVTTIEAYAFTNSGLTSVSLPGSIQTILDNAFVGTQIQELYLPASITYLGSSIITNCKIRTASSYVNDYCKENNLTCIYEEPSSDETTGSTEPSSDETTGSTEPSSDETTGSTEPSSDETTGSTEPSSDETTGSTEPPSDETTGSTEPSSDETTGSTEPSSDETTGSTEPSSDETTGSTEPSSDETTGSTEPSSDETTGSTEPSSDETTGSTEPSSDETTGSTEPSSDETTGSTEPSSDETTGSTEPSSDETTGSTEPTEEPTEKLTYKFAKKYKTLKVGTTKMLELKANDGSYADSRFITWKSSNTRVLKVESGKVTAVSNGKSTIYAEYNGQTFKITIEVKTPATGITMKKKSIMMVEGKKTQLKATLKPLTSTDAIKWSSSNKKIATVNSKGVVKALKPGYVSITAKTTSGKIASCKITVKGLPNKISLSRKNITIKIGNTYRLKYVLPRNTVAKVSFSTVDKRIATVNSKGVIKAKAKGTTTIVAITSNGKIARCKVNVVRI